MVRKLTSKEKRELKAMEKEYTAYKEIMKQRDLIIKTTVNPKVKSKLKAERKDLQKKLDFIAKELEYFKSIS